MCRRGKWQINMFSTNKAEFSPPDISSFKYKRRQKNSNY